MKVLINNRQPDSGDFPACARDVVDLLAIRWGPILRSAPGQEPGAGATTARTTICFDLRTSNPTNGADDGPEVLLVGHEDSQFASVYDLDLLQPVPSDCTFCFRSDTIRNRSRHPMARYWRHRE